MPEQQPLLDGRPPDLTEQIAELERELAVRRDVYPRWIDNGKIKRQTANYRIECLRATLELLNEIQGHIGKVSSFELADRVAAKVQGGSYGDGGEA